MGWLASESVAVNFEQSEQIRQLESFYGEAIAMTRAEEDVAASEPVTVPATFPEQVRVELSRKIQPAPGLEIFGKLLVISANQLWYARPKRPLCLSALASAAVRLQKRSGRRR